MIPKFLQPERLPYASVEIVRAPRDAFHTFLTDPATGPHLDALLADNARLDAQLEADRDEFARAAAQDHHEAIDEERNEQWDADMAGSRCGAGCGFCGRCS